MKKKIIIMASLLLVIIAVVGSSYAYLKAEKGSTNNNQITLGDLDVILLTDISNITIDKALPVEDSIGLTNSKVTFQIKNNAGTIANYKVSLVDGATKSTMLNKDVRYQLKRTNTSTSETITMDITNLADTGLIDTGVIDTGVIYTYELVMWLDINSNPNGLVFAKNILVEGMQVASLDKSGANYPELLDNMIPVYYDKTSDTEGVWRVADSKNLNETYKWFDYKDFMWANAVTVNKDVMDNYYGYSGAEATSELNVNIETNEEKTITHTLNEITFASTNQSKASSSSILKLTFHTTTAGTLSFNYTLGSEANYDKLTIKINNGSTDTTLVDAKSGSISSTAVSTDLVADTDYTFTATYSKDSSGDKNGDTATITDLTISATLTADPVKDGTVTYPWSGDIQEVIPANKQMASSAYTYDDTTGIFTLTNPTEIAYTSSKLNYYTCNSSVKTTCVKLYKIVEIDANNTVTKVEVHQGSNKGAFGSVLGQEVKMEDITTMWVWIPRYKYVIWSGNNGTSEEQLINVVFEHGIDTTGTVTCVDNILTSDTSSSSETCTDTTNGSIVNHKSTYTHPAFTFGKEELTGFWYAKFEMSTDQDSTCVTSQSNTNCNVTGQNIYIKPDQISLRYISNANSFVNIRNMELFNNVHGFTQDTNATTSSSQTGEIINDTNDYDIHMQKNMEWGAVTYLSYSEYGKYGNYLYTGTNKRVYKNNYYTSSIYKTGYSEYSYNASSSTNNTVLYNDLTDLGSGKGYKGAGASTTGTIYGIYDMNGGAYDRTMGNMVNSSGNFYSSSSGFSTSPLEKYYDKYSYSTSNSGNPSVLRSKLGDAIKEMTKGFSTTGSWEGSYRYMPISSSSWFVRGGSSDASARFGLSYSNYNDGAANNYYSSRPVLVCAREFPWIK